MITQKHAYERGKGHPAPKSGMNRKQLFTGLMMGFLLLLLLTVTAGAAEDPLRLQMELSKQIFSGPETVWVSITVTNQSDSDLPGPMTLYDPDRKQVEDFGTPILSAGESRRWTGSWDVTEEQLATGKLTFGIRFFVDGEDGQPVEKVRYFSKRIRIDEAAPEVSDQPGGGAAENGGRPMLPKFLATAEKYFQELSFAENDYDAVFSLPEQQVVVNIRQENGITEIESEDFGTVQIGEEIGLFSNGTTIIVDYASIFDFVQELFSEKQSDQAAAYLNRLYQRALTELVLPFAETVVMPEQLSFHLNLDSRTVMKRLEGFVTDSINDEDFRSAYAVLGPILHALSPEIPETAEGLLEACAPLRSYAVSASPEWRVDADLLVTLDGGSVKEIALSGYYDSVFADDYHYPFSLDLSDGETGFFLRADADLPFGSFTASVTGNQISAEILGNSDYDTLYLEGSFDSLSGTLDLKMNNYRNETLGTIRGQFLENLMDVTVQYLNQTTEVLLVRGEHFYHGRLSGSLNRRLKKETGYQVDVRVYEEPNQEYRVVVNSESGRGTDAYSWTAEAVVGPSRLSVQFAPANPYTPMFSLSAQRLDRSRYDFRVEYAEGPENGGNLTPYMIHLTGEDKTWDFDFSYPYGSWSVEGGGTVLLNEQYEPVAVSGRAATSCYGDLTGYQETDTLEYVPGRLTVSLAPGDYVLERTRDDEDYLIWQLSLDNELLYQLEFNLTETDRGPGISGCLSTGEDVPIAELTVSPVVKEWVLPLNRENAILVNADTIPSLINMLINMSLTNDYAY